MRKMLATTVALESIVNPVITGLISLEEEQLLLGEASELGNEISNDLGEVDRLAETSDVLEDLAVIADGISNATPTEVDLLNAAGSMAVTGTDIPSEEIIPAMESFKGKKVAIESFSAKAKTIWENIQKFVKKIWDNITLFFKKIFTTLPNLKKRVTELKAKVEKTEGKNDEESIIVSAGVSYLATDGKAIKNEADYLKSFSRLVTANKFALYNVPDSVKKAGNEIAKNIAAFNPATPDASANDLIKDLENLKTALSSDFKNIDILGNVTLSVKSTDVAADANVLAKLDAYKNLGAEIKVTDKVSFNVDSVQIKPLSISGSLGLLKFAEEIILEIEDFEKNMQKDMNGIADSIKKASDKATSAFKETSDNKAAEPIYRAMLNYNQTYLKMISSPATKMISVDMAAINVLLMVVNKSLTGYKADKLVTV
jgi:hypothetical protein